MKSMNKSFTLAMAAIVAVMALAACSGSGSKLEDYVSTVNKECPADFEIGTLNSVEIVGDNVVFNYKANGSTLIKAASRVSKAMSILLKTCG